MKVQRGLDVIAEYGYDALDRRVHRKISNSGLQNTEGQGDFLYYDGHGVIDQFHDSPPGGSPTRSEFVYGLDYIDEPVAQYITVPGGVLKRFLLQDANYNVVAATSDTGVLREQYRYEPYGLRTAIEDGNGNPIDINAALVLNPFGIHGLWWDPVTRTYHLRIRELSPEFMRMLQGDPVATTDYNYRRR